MADLKLFRYQKLVCILSYILYMRNRTSYFMSYSILVWATMYLSLVLSSLYIVTMPVRYVEKSVGVDILPKPYRGRPRW